MHFKQSTSEAHDLLGSFCTPPEACKECLPLAPALVQRQEQLAGEQESSEARSHA